MALFPPCAAAKWVRNQIPCRSFRGWKERSITGRKTMPVYRLYLMNGSTGHIDGFEEIASVDDVGATRNRAPWSTMSGRAFSRSKDHFGKRGAPRRCRHVPDRRSSGTE